MGETRNEYKPFVGLSGKWPLGRPRRIWEAMLIWIVGKQVVMQGVAEINMADLGLVMLSLWCHHLEFELARDYLKSTMFGDITPCSPLKVSRRFGGT
jgi:hypothetical protein